MRRFWTGKASHSHYFIRIVALILILIFSHVSASRLNVRLLVKQIGEQRSAAWTIDHGVFASGLHENRSEAQQDTRIALRSTSVSDSCDAVDREEAPSPCSAGRWRKGL